MAESYVSKLLKGKSIEKCEYISGIVIDFGNNCILGCNEDSFFSKGSAVLPCEEVIGLRFVDFLEKEELEIFVFDANVTLNIPLLYLENWVYKNNEGVIMVST